VDMNDQDIYLKTIFARTDYVNIVYESFKETRAVPVTLVRGYPKWVCVNPIKPRHTRAAKNVETYRNFLVEFDCGSIEEQWKWIDTYGVPYATVVFSGNRSLHAVISLNDGVTKDEYRKIARMLKLALPNADSACFEPARLTRMPCGMQPMVRRAKTISLAALYAWLEDKGIPKETEDLSAISHGKDLVPDKITKSTVNLLSGNTPKEDGHRVALQAAKNLMEVGYSQAEVISILSGVRQMYMPEEDLTTSKHKTERLVEWVEQNWHKDT